MSTCDWEKEDARSCSRDLAKHPEQEEVKNSEQFLSTQEFFLRINQKKAATSQHNFLNLLRETPKWKTVQDCGPFTTQGCVVMETALQAPLAIPVYN